MTTPAANGDELAALLDGLDASPWERLQLEEVLGEIDAEEEAGLPFGSLGGEPGPGDDELPPGGPWNDDLAAFGAIGGTLDRTRELDAQRLAEDVADQIPDRRPPTDEVKAARALDRISRGTYTQPLTLRPARDSGGAFAVSCGEALDDFGRCASRYHTNPACSAVTYQAAATGSATEIEAWRDVLNGRTPAGGVDASALGLANPATPRPGDGIDGWADLLEDRGPAGPYEDLRAAMMAELALADRPAPPPREGPDVSGLRAALGI